MYRRHALTFITGRLLALVVLFGFQIVVVRVLAPKEYATYSLYFAFASLMQATASFGIPRLIAKYVSQAGVKLSHRTVRKICLALIGVRLVGSVLFMAIPVTVMAVFFPKSLGDVTLLAVGIGFILASSLQYDADSMSQALMLQTNSRRSAIGEPVLRLALIVLEAALLGLHTALGVLAVSCATAVMAAALLLFGVFRKLASEEETSSDVKALDLGEFRSTAIGGYASAMAWFASSPAIVRLIASRLVTTTVFAGFGFSQSLVLSFQRYSPGFILFPFVEPAVMNDLARTGDPSKLRSALSLVTKIDMIIIGAAIVGISIAGKPLVDLMTGGKYGAEAYAIPWLLAYIATSSVYRSFEIAAIALGASSAFVVTLTISLVWLAILVVLGLKFGLIALLLCPLADALTRLAFMQRVLAKAGTGAIIDLPVAALVALSVIAFCIGGGALTGWLHAGAIGTVLIACLSGALFLGVAVALRPLRSGEAALLGSRGGRMARVVNLLVRTSPEPAIS